MIRKRHIIFLLITFCSAINAQTVKRHLKEVLKDAQYYLDADNYFKACQLYKEILSIEPNHHLAGVDAAFCMAKLNYPIDSLFFLEANLTQSANVDSKYYLAKIKHKQKLFDEAIVLLSDYKKTDRKHHLKADDEIDYLIGVCTNAKQFIANTHQALIKNLGENINSEFDDYVPAILPDESIMYFTSKRKNDLNNKNGDNNYFEDIYVSKKSGGIWQKAENIGFPLNTENNDACVAINQNGSKMIVYRSSPDGKGHLYLSAFGTHQHWGPLTKLNVEINSAFIETSACFSDDSTCIYFSSNRPGGFGGKDIYRIKKLPSGRWGKAFNLGPSINTKYDEDAPFLTHDGTTLYFSSKGHNTMGEYDVFKSAYDETNSQFTKAENLGYPINDVGNDIFFVLSGDGNTGYYSSIKSVNYGGEDIYSIDMRYSENAIVVKEGYVFLNNEPGKAKIVIKDENTGTVIGEYYSNANTGKYIVAVNPLSTYKLTVSAEGFEKVKTHICLVANENNNDYLKFNLNKKSEP